MALMHKAFGWHGTVQCIVGVLSLTRLNILSNAVHIFSPFCVATVGVYTFDKV